MSEKNLYENEDHTWTIRMQTLIKRKKNLQIAQTIDEAINEWYSLHNLPVPDWKCNRDPDWWIEYLKEQGIDPRNR
jgi:hypothetical protein